MTNDKAITQLEKLRSQIGTINQQLQETDRESLSRDETAERINRFIDIQAIRLTDHASTFTSSNDSLPDGLYADHGIQIADYSGDVKGTNLGPALAALFPERLREYLLSRTDEYGDYGRPRSEIKQHVKELEHQRLTLETEEEQLICTIEATGTEVERRLDIGNPIVVALKAS